MSRSRETADRDERAENRKALAGGACGAVGEQPAPSPEERLVSVEAEVAFQGDALREVSDALGAQQMDVLALQRQVQLLGEQLSALRADVARSGPGGGDDEPPPPHY